MMILGIFSKIYRIIFNQYDITIIMDVARNATSNVTSNVTRSVRNFFDTSSEAVKGLLENVTEKVLSVKNSFLKGFGLGSSIIFLIIGLCYLGLYAGTKDANGCQKPFEQHCIAIGSIYLGLAALSFVPFITNISIVQPVVKILLAAVPLLLLGLQIWGYVILLRDEGIACAHNGDPKSKQLWLGLIVLTILGTAGLGSISTFGGVVGTAEASSRFAQ